MKMELSILNAILLAVVAIVTLDVSGAEPAQGVEQVTRMTLGRKVALADSGQNLIHILDSDGSVLWQYPAAKPRDVWVLPNGNVLFTHGTGVQEVTRDEQVVWQYAFPKTLAFQPHAGRTIS